MDLLADIDQLIQKKNNEVTIKKVDQNKLFVEEIKRVIRKAVIQQFKGQKYQHIKIKEQQTLLIDNILNKLKLLKLPLHVDAMKFIVSVSLSQANFHGFHSAATSFIDKVLDRHIVMNLIEDDFSVSINVFALAV